ncbi:MAG: hypothetical protein C4B59_03695 [Candidatus Methanogaster sp.]|uniref:Uncharacterized protein n=1 Tax=Candidatus Methanogaster sp. TaxID=3386292 RepID=A0AC61L5B7_9EURY|nr:MAG: hypothetical protein C4B59_03695 [ANME-2 cluster archaeon]
MNKVSFIYLSQEDVKKSGGMDMAQTIRDIEDVLVMRHSGECVVPHKVVLRKCQWQNQCPARLSGR